MRFSFNSIFRRLNMSEKPDPKKDNTNTYLTVAEVAKALRVSSRTVYRWMEIGKLKAFRPTGGGGSTRIQLSELNRFIEENTGTHQKEDK